MSSKGGGDTSQVVTTEAPEFQQPYLERLFSEAESLYDTGGPEYFPYSTVAPLAPAETEAQQSLLNYAGGAASDTAAAALDTQNFLLGDVLYPESNPALTGYIEGAIDPVFERLEEVTLPTIRSGARVAGGQGGTRQALAEGTAIDRATEDALQASSEIASKGYDSGLEALTEGLALAPTTLYETGTAPAIIASDVGGQQREYGEALLEDAISRYNYGETSPYTALDEFAKIVGSPVGSTSTGITDEGGSSFLEDLFGVGLTGLALYGLL